MKNSFLEIIEQEAKEFLELKGFKKIFDNDLIPHDEKESHTSHVIYSDNKRKLKISARDWRDFYYLYYVQLDDTELVEVDCSVDLQRATDQLIEKIKEIK